MNYVLIIIGTLILSLMVLVYFNIFHKEIQMKNFYNKKLLGLILLVFNIIVSYILHEKYGFRFYYFSLILLINILLCISVIDYKTKYIPNILLLIMFAIGMWTMFFIPDITFYNPLTTAIVLFLIMLLLNKLSKNSIGMGDVKIIPILSLYLGYYKVSSVIFIALVISLIYGVALVIKNKQSLKTEIPFAPFIFIGLIINLLL